jgi:hypothetical protein
MQVGGLRGALDDDANFSGEGLNTTKKSFIVFVRVLNQSADNVHASTPSTAPAV